VPILLVQVSVNPYSEYVDLWNVVPAVWQPHLSSVRKQIEDLGDALDAMEQQGVKVNPEPSRIFAALDVAPQNVRVVIVGQDPYPNPAHAMGLSFSVPPGTAPLPPSLRNIIAEVTADIGDCAVADGCLVPWLDQGVLLLNRVLTVTSGQSDSHKQLGWQSVTQAILQTVVRVNPGVIAVLWGSQAQQLREIFDPEHVIASVHPSPLSAYRGFLGSRPFSRTNQFLLSGNLEPINW